MSIKERLASGIRSFYAWAEPRARRILISSRIARISSEPNFIIGRCVLQPTLAGIAIFVTLGVLAFLSVILRSDSLLQLSLWTTSALINLFILAD